jgi:hypothetical protein
LGGGGVLFDILNNFWGGVRRTCFPAKFYLFYEIKKLKEEKEREKKYIRSLKNVLVVLEEIFYMRSVIFFSGNFCNF